MFNLFNKKRIQELEEENILLIEEISDLRDDIENGSFENELLDLLGLPIDFYNTDDDGSPKYPLDKMTKEERDIAIVNLENLYHNKELNMLFEYLINLFGNYAVRSDNGNAGRYSINGIVRLKKLIQEAHNEFTELHQPKKSFDDQEIL